MKLYAACMMCLLSAQERKLREYRDEDKKARYIKGTDAFDCGE